MMLLKGFIFLALGASALPSEIDLQERGSLDCKRVSYVGHDASAYCSSLLHISPVTTTCKTTHKVTATAKHTVTHTSTVTGGALGGTVTKIASTCTKTSTIHSYVFASYC